VIVGTALVPAFFIQLDEPTRTLNTWKLLAKIGSLCGTVLLFWQFLLGYRQLASRWVACDYLWTLRIHKLLGVAAVALILLHPIFITPYYLRKRDLWLLWVDLPWPLNVLVPGGIVAFLILVAIAVTSTLLREKMGKRAWYLTHLSSYVLLPLVFIHGYPIGMTLAETGLRHVWQVLFVLTGALYLFRALARFGAFSSVYEVKWTDHVTENVVELCMQPTGRPIRPASGQFAFFRRGLSQPARPFTVSKYDETSGELCITVKALGRTTRQLQNVQVGERFLVDGPYGVFGQAALISPRPVVMLAGGIGITPFRRLIRELEKQPDREAFLFYGNQYEEDIAHREEIEGAPHVEVVHVLSGEEEHEYLEVGFITIELVEKYLDRNLSHYEFLLCGPPVMVEKLESGLRAKGIPRGQIHHELFSY
jgi:predicted ferric reductase